MVVCRVYTVSKKNGCRCLCVWREGDRFRGIDIAEREKFKVRVFFMDVVEFNRENNGQVRNFTYQRIVFFLAL